MLTHILELIGWATISGGVHFTASNNDCGVRDFDMERFQLVNHFSYPWPVNVSYVGGSEFSYLVGYIMYVLTFCSTITEIVVSFCIMTSAAIICLTFLEICHIFTNVARELRKLTPVKCFSLGKPGQICYWSIIGTSWCECLRMYEILSTCWKSAWLDSEEVGSHYPIICFSTFLFFRILCTCWIQELFGRPCTYTSLMIFEPTLSIPCQAAWALVWCAV